MHDQYNQAIRLCVRNLLLQDKENKCDCATVLNRQESSSLDFQCTSCNAELMCNYLNYPMAIKKKLYCCDLLIAAIVGCRSVEVIKRKESCRNRCEKDERYSSMKAKLLLRLDPNSRFSLFCPLLTSISFRPCIGSFCQLSKTWSCSITKIASLRLTTNLVEAQPAS